MKCFILTFADTSAKIIVALQWINYVQKLLTKLRVRSFRLIWNYDKSIKKALKELFVKQ
jgi:hypothetical protein